MNDDTDDFLNRVLSEARPIAREQLRVDHKGIESLSMIALIANPDAYHQKKVRFIGYLHVAFEGEAIYLHREDFLNCIFKNALSIRQPDNMPLEQWLGLNDQYVLCEGTFRSDWLGHMASNSGTVQEVTRLEPLVQATA